MCCAVHCSVLQCAVQVREKAGKVPKAIKQARQINLPKPKKIKAGRSKAGDTPGHAGEPRGRGAVHVHAGPSAPKTNVVIPQVVAAPARRARKAVP